MKCKAVKKYLVPLAEGEFDGIDIRPVKAHIKKCAHCRKELMEIKKVLKLSGSITVNEPESAYWVNFLPELRKKMGAKRTVWNKIFNPYAVFSLGAAVLLVILNPLNFINNNPVKSAMSMEERILLHKLGKDAEYALKVINEISINNRSWEENPEVLTEEQANEITKQITLDYFKENI